MNSHAIAAWLAVLLRRIGSEAGVCQTGRHKARYLFIVLDSRTGLLQTEADKMGNRRQYYTVVVLLLYYFYCVVFGNILCGRTLQTSPSASVC